MSGMIEVRLHEVRRLFNSLDPAPFIEKDLDADAENYLYDWWPIRRMRCVYEKIRAMPIEIRPLPQP